MREQIELKYSDEIKQYKDYLIKLNQAVDNNKPDHILTLINELNMIAPFIFYTDMVEDIKTSFKAAKWNNALNTFNQHIDKPYSFYIGPLKAMDNEANKLGFILLKQKKYAAEIYTKLSQFAIGIGEKLFDAPCSFGGRYVEFYDIMYASQQFLTSAVNKIAIFSPFYFGAIDLHQVSARRRSIIFHNVIKLRYENITKPCLNHILIDGESPMLLTASAEQVDQAITLWICLHEMMHSSGPIPFFGAQIKKKKLGFNYAHIEEARVDMTSYLFVSNLYFEFGIITQLVKELILFERLLRSARQIHFAGYNSANNFDCFHGLLWVDVLEREHAFAIDSQEHMLRIESAQAYAAIKKLLQNIYTIEKNALLARGDDEPYQILNSHASMIKQELMAKYFSSLYDISALRKYYGQFKKFVDFDIKYVEK